MKNKSQTGLSRLSFLTIATSEKDYFIDNFAMLLGSGMSVSAAIDGIYGELKSKALKRLVDQMRDDINAGFPIWQALDRAGLLPQHMIFLVRIGEQTGRLSENLKLIALQQQKNRIFRSKIRAAMIYPILVLSLTSIAGIGIAWFILPKLATVFADLRLPLPAITRGLIAVGNFLGEWGSIAVPAAAVVVILIFYFLFVFSKTKFMGQAILLAFPGVKTLTRELELARLGYIFGTLLKAGVPIVEALASLSSASQFRRYAKFYDQMRQSIEVGNSLQKTFAVIKHSKKLIPLPVQQMIVAAEQSGTLTETMIKIGENFEEKTEASTKNLPLILEPVLLVIVGIGVAAVAAAIILPIYSLIGGVSQVSQPAYTYPTPIEVVEEPPPDLPEEEVMPEEPTEEVPIVEEETGPKIEILESELGYVNVRDNPKLQSNIIGQVLPGESFAYEDEENGWYQITLPEGSLGWVYGRYAKKITD